MDILDNYIKHYFINIIYRIIIVYGNAIPIPNILSDFLIKMGIPIEGGNLFGREFNR